MNTFSEFLKVIFGLSEAVLNFLIFNSIKTYKYHNNNYII